MRNEEREWQEQVVRQVREGVAELGSVVNMLVVKQKDGKQVAIPATAPQLNAPPFDFVRWYVKQYRGEIEQVGLILKAYEIELNDTDMRQVMKDRSEGRMTDVKAILGDDDKPPNSVHVIFESRNVRRIVRFTIHGNRLTEQHPDLNDSVVTLGLWVQDTGMMYG